MLNREQLQQQDKLNLLNTTSLRLIPILAESVDLDGLIQVSEDQIKELGYMTPKLVPSAIEGLLNIGWIRKGQDGKLYSLYTCNTSPENKAFYYINFFKIFKKEVFKSMYKRRINLMYYILTSKIPGTWHSIAIERLYKNKTLSDKLAIESFDDFDDLMNNFIPLIEAGIIEVRLGRENTTFTQKSTNLKEKIYAFCGKTDLAVRKKRMRGEKDGHVFHIRMANEVLKEKTTIFDIDRRSTLRDLETIASQYDYSLDVFNQESLEEVHMVKHKIYKEFGNLGIKIYRESLQSFFELSSHSFARLMDNKEFGKTIKNHYVIPRIKMELTNSVRELESKQNLSKTEAFLRYITTEAYLDDLVTIDHNMNTSYPELYKTVQQTNAAWKEFADKVEGIYKKEGASGNTPEIVLELAFKGELTSKKRVEKELKQKLNLKHQSNTISKSYSSTKKTEMPKEIREHRDRLRAFGLLQPNQLQDVDCDF